jgi:hypothetical protein
MQKQVVAKMEAILQYLWENGPVEDKSGLATGLLLEATGIGGDSKAPYIVLKTLEAKGFIAREMKGKRTFSIALGEVRPTDWFPTPPRVIVSGEVAEDITEDKVTEGYREQEIVETPLTKAPVDIIPTEPTEALDGRPGRLAARIERTIPTLVQEGVQQGIEGAINGFLARMGVGLGSDEQANAQVQELETLNMEYAEKIADLRQELRVERQMHEASRQELNKVTARTEGNVSGSKVRSHDMPEMYRDLATHAIANGWTIDKTPGNHYRWKSPLGGGYFSPSTPGDWRGVRNARKDMEKIGLPKQ